MKKIVTILILALIGFGAFALPNKEITLWGRKCEVFYNCENTLYSFDEAVKWHFILCDNCNHQIEYKTFEEVVASMMISTEFEKLFEPILSNENYGHMSLYQNHTLKSDWYLLEDGNMICFTSK